MNDEFQELKRKYGINSAERAKILKDMKTNLKNRNGGKSEYIFEYTKKGVACEIDNCNFEDLFAIDGDMNPRGM